MATALRRARRDLVPKPAKAAKQTNSVTGAGAVHHPVPVQKNPEAAAESRPTPIRPIHEAAGASVHHAIADDEPALAQNWKPSIQNPLTSSPRCATAVVSLVRWRNDARRQTLLVPPVSAAAALRG